MRFTLPLTLVSILAFAALDGFSQQVPQATAFYVNSITNTVTTSGGNDGGTLSLTNDISASLYHTFQFTSVSTNATTCWLYRSVDGSGWNLVGSNNLAANGTGEQSMTGKWRFFRFLVTGSNTVTTAKYMGGR